jgi:hypothetical protein
MWKGPGGRLEKVKRPSAEVVVTRGGDADSRVRVMRAPEMESPSRSVIVPEMVPVAWVGG